MSSHSHVHSPNPHHPPFPARCTAKTQADISTVNILLTLGSERLYSDLSRKFSTRTDDERVSVLRIDKSGGCVDRSPDYMKALRHAQIREYFFGHGEDALAPSSMSADFGDLNIFKVVESKSYISFFFRKTCVVLWGDANVSCLLGGANQFAAGDADDYGSSAGSGTIYERVTPSSALMNKLLAITTASPNDKHEVIRDSSVRGYIYVADVDEGKRKVRLLSPQPGHLPGSAMVLGSWPEDVAGLVS